jgi:hypothetical protein
MIEKITTEMISRRKALSLRGLALQASSAALRIK